MNKTDLRIVFMGTPDFAVATLHAIIREGFNVVGVVTQMDKPVGRHGNSLRKPAVKVAALELGIPVLQPEKLKDPSFLSLLKAFNGNLFVVVAFRMLPFEVWSMPLYGTFNVHAGLLPQYRGAAPINWVLINDEKQTGITTFFIDKNIDTGRIILRKSCPIYENDNAEILHDRLMFLGAQTCIDTLYLILSSKGEPKTIDQSDCFPSSVTDVDLHLAPKLNKENCRISWNKPSNEIYNLIRGLSPVPGAWTTMSQKKEKCFMVKVYVATKTTLNANLPVGEVYINGNQLYANTADFLLRIDELQLEGRRRLSSKEFLNGLRENGNIRFI